MQQRIYHGTMTVEGLADYLVQRFDPQHNLQAQKLGQGDSLAVQIGRGDVAEELRHAITVGITRVTDSEQGVAVTLGQQQWITPKLATYAAMIGLVGLLVTPWALFGLLWPVSELIGSQALPDDIWNAVETYALSQGAALGDSRELDHPHVG
jgi:hypothetical protein